MLLSGTVSMTEALQEADSAHVSNAITDIQSDVTQTQDSSDFALSG